MSGRWDQLLQPITAERPCGESLEDTELLASFDAYRLFGQSKPLDALPEEGEKRVPKPIESPEWVEIRDKALEALAKSRDLRLLAYLGTAVLRTDGVPAFSDTLGVVTSAAAPASAPDSVAAALSGCIAICARSTCVIRVSCAESGSNIGVDSVPAASRILASMLRSEASASTTDSWSCARFATGVAANAAFTWFSSTWVSDSPGVS